MSVLSLPTTLVALQVYLPPSFSPKLVRMRSERESVEVMVTRGSVGERGEPLWSQVMVGGGTLS